MPSPEQHSRDDLYRRLPDGSYERVADGVVPRAELERVLCALRKEREVTHSVRARITELRKRLRALVEEQEPERVVQVLKELTQ